jgi:hypothetical protein
MCRELTLCRPARTVSTAAARRDVEIRGPEDCDGPLLVRASAQYSQSNTDSRSAKPGLPSGLTSTQSLPSQTMIPM